jgi:uncharacterized membrane protein YphA (DoxX/SURF4 family)
MKKPTANCMVAWALRLSLASAFLSAVADRFGLWGAPGANNIAWGAWQPFVTYTGKLLFFLPQSLFVIVAIVATAAEIALGVLLLSGWRTRMVALASAGLLLAFALSMTLALGVKAPLNYSVFPAAAGALALAALASKSEPS